MFRRLIALSAVVLSASALVQCNKSKNDVTEDAETRDARWHFVRQEQPAPETTLTAVYGNSLGELYVVGWGGVILTNRGGSWQRMPSPTAVNLTAITGVENGGVFDLPSAHGEMIAVGWHGTVLHYHPNPDANPETEDGTWSIIASAGDPVTGQLGAATQDVPYFSPLMKPDPMCPDFDGDGRGDDGDGDGWIGNAGGIQHICANGLASGCDDNCRNTANGNQRPLGNTGGSACVGPGSVPDLSRDQVDADNDAIGWVCDDDDFSPSERVRFTSTLFSVWARANGDDLQVIAVGESGAVVAFDGVSAGGTATALNPAVTSFASWEAQTTLAFRYVDDCDPATPAGTACDNGRLPPSCPAQCSPLKTTCTCPADGGQCCDASAPTGAPNAEGVPAANACRDGKCSSQCPGCFRRLEETLRSISVDGNTVAAVGSRGTIVFGALDDLTADWSAPSCTNPPKPLDERPVLAAVRGQGGGNFQIVGAAGAIFRGNNGGACSIDSRTGAPQGFLSAILPTGGDSSYVVGDEGLFIEVNGANLEPIVTNIDQNIFGIWRTFAPLSDDELRSTGREPEDLDPTVPREDVARYWLIGAGGTVVQAAFY